jgi:PAS domain S-box-containing protein
MQALFQGSPNAVAVTDVNGIVRVVNDRALALFGHSDASEVIGNDMMVWLPEEEHERVQGGLRLLCEHGTVRDRQFTLQRKDGSRFAGEIQATVIRPSGSDSPLIFLSISDVTERHLYQRALQSILRGTAATVGAEFFRSFVLELSAALQVRFAFIARPIKGDHGRMRTLAIAADGVIVPNMEYEMDGTPCAFAGTEQAFFVPRGVRQRFPEAAHLNGWKAEGYLGIRLLSLTGEFRGIVAVVHDRPFEDTAIARSVIAIFSARAAAEIDRVEADEGLWANEQRLRSVIDNAPFGAHLYELQPDGSLVFAGHNRAADRILKVDHHAIVGKTIEEAWPGLVGTPIPETYKKVATGGEVYRENAIQYESGDIHGAFEIHAFQTGGNRMAVFFRDVTERKRAESELLLAKKKAEDANSAKSILLKNLSHEFRTPITGILGLAEILHEEEQDPSLKELVEGISASGRRLHNTLDSILKLAQLTSGDVHMKPVPVQVPPVVHRVLERYRVQAEAKGLELRTEIGDGGGVMLADEELLVDVLAYLVDNAVKYTRRGGIAIVSRSVGQNGTLRGCIDVRDTGIGIAAEHFEVIFEEFKQLSEGTSREFEGSGVGLTVARKMARMLGGDITVASNVGAGSTFSVWLPVPDTLPAEKKPTPESAWRPGRTGRERVPEALIVEDNFVNEAVMAEFLRPLCLTDHAPDGVTAIQMAGKKRYDVILMDINLGSGPDGIQTARVIRGIEGYESVPIIAVTGYTLPGDRERLISEGLTMYLPKPFDRSDIQDVVRRALS